MKTSEPVTTKEFVTQQRNAANVLLTLFGLGLLGVWGHAFVDWAFNLSWGSDPRTLWIAPSMALFAFVLRYVAFALFGFVEKNY